MPSRPNKPSIALLATPETSPSVLYGMYDVLLSVGAVYADMTTGKPEDCLIDVRIVAATDKPFRCFGNVLVEPSAALDDVAEADVVVVCDIYTPIDTPPRGRYQREIAWLKRMYAKGSIVAAVCSGTLIPAEAGLLDGRECAGHCEVQALRIPVRRGRREARQFLPGRFSPYGLPPVRLRADLVELRAAPPGRLTR